MRDWQTQDWSGPCNYINARSFDSTRSIMSSFVLYNDNTTSVNHMSSSQWSAEAVTRIGPQPLVDPHNGKYVFAYDSYTRTTWMIGRNGQLFRDWKAINLDDYRAIWVEVNFCDE